MDRRAYKSRVSNIESKVNLPLGGSKRNERKMRRRDGPFLAVRGVSTTTTKSETTRRWRSRSRSRSTAFASRIAALVAISVALLPSASAMAEATTTTTVAAAVAVAACADPSTFGDGGRLCPRAEDGDGDGDVVDAVLGEMAAAAAADTAVVEPPLWPAGEGMLVSLVRYVLHVRSPPSDDDNDDDDERAGAGHGSDAASSTSDSASAGNGNRRGESKPKSRGSGTAIPRNPLAAFVINSDFFLEYCAKTSVVRSTVERLNGVLSWAGVPPRNSFTEDELVLYLFAAFWTLAIYYLAVGKRHGRNRRMLAKELREALLQVHDLQEQLFLAQAKHIPSKTRRVGEVRIFMDGAFDMMHYGHMNAFRLARSLGTKLVVGINSDQSITECKGAPLMNDDERGTMVRGCKFVDEVVPEEVPYVMNAEYVEYIINKYDIDYVVHGDDPCIVDGKDVYAAAKEAGKYQSIPRTEGVSTTDIVGRMLTLTKDHHCVTTPTSKRGERGRSSSFASLNGDGADDHSVPSVVTAATATAFGNDRPLGETSKFLTTSRMIRLFSAGMEPPEPGMRVIYMDGAWDMFHCGHVSILKVAKQRGDYLIVGVHGDGVVNRVRGGNLPIMNLHERVLSVMGCRYVDDVLIDAPYRVTPDMVASLKIAEVVHGSRSDDVCHHDGHGANGGLLDDEEDREDRWGERYAYPREAGIFTVLPSPSTFDVGSIMDRIRRNQNAFQAKIARKKAAEGKYYDERYGRKNGCNSEPRQMS